MFVEACECVVECAMAPLAGHPYGITQRLTDDLRRSAENAGYLGHGIMRLFIVRRLQAIPIHLAISKCKESSVPPLPMLYHPVRNVSDFFRIKAIARCSGVLSLASVARHLTIGTGTCGTAAGDVGVTPSEYRRGL